jgi:sRNA-binding carbon storage regulator CsrA
MGLKLTVSKGDKIHIGEDVVLTVNYPTSAKIQLEFDAPLSVSIWTEFLNKAKQDKNRKNAERQNALLVGSDSWLDKRYNK